MPVSIFTNRGSARPLFKIGEHTGEFVAQVWLDSPEFLLALLQSRGISENDKQVIMEECPFSDMCGDLLNPVEQGQAITVYEGYCDGNTVTITGVKRHEGR